MFGIAGLIIVLQHSRTASPEVRAFLSVQERVLAVKSNSGWHEPTDSARFSMKPYPVTTVLLGRAGAETGFVNIHKDREWGWVADATKDLPYDEILCSGIRPKFPRKVITSRDPKGVYRSAALAIFKSKNFPVDRIDSLQICRVDLRGDGREEVLVAAQAAGKVNPATVVFLRQLGPRGVSTEVLEFQVMGFPKIAAIGDLTGDGTMQAVIAGGISDGAMGSLWSFKTPKPKKIAGFIWGE